MADSIITRLRRSKLKQVAELQRNHFHAESCSAFVTIVTLSAVYVQRSRHPADDMMDDLFAVLIGDGYFGSKRSHGPYFAGHFAPATGFKAMYFDPNNQVQHVFAGIYVAYKHHSKGDIVMLLSMINEFKRKEPQDVKLYYIGRFLGKWLRTHKNQYRSFSRKILNTICVKNSKLYGVGR